LVLGSCAAEKMSYAASCVQWQVNPRGDVPSASWNRISLPFTYGTFTAKMAVFF
jgi:hypothetical protein